MHYVLCWAGLLTTSCMKYSMLSWPEHGTRNTETEAGWKRSRNRNGQRTVELRNMAARTETTPEGCPGVVVGVGVGVRGESDQRSIPFQTQEPNTHKCQGTALGGAPRNRKTRECNKICIMKNRIVRWKTICGPENSNSLPEEWLYVVAWLLPPWTAASPKWGTLWGQQRFI